MKRRKLEKDDIIQIAPTHKWGGCLAVVDEPKSFGCLGHVKFPNGVLAYIRLDTTDYEEIGAKAVFCITEERRSDDATAAHGRISNRRVEISYDVAERVQQRRPCGVTCGNGQADVRDIVKRNAAPFIRRK